MRKAIVVIIECALVVVLGIGGYVGLSSLRRDPVLVAPEEQAIRVEAIRVSPEDEPVIIMGYGTARSRDVVTIMPEVPGIVVELNPKLEVGGIIPKGELLFAIDPRTYEAQVENAHASIGSLESSLAVLKTTAAADRQRLTTLARTRDLALSDFERLKGLFEDERVGAKAQVERAERAYIQVKDQLDQLQQAVQTYPGRIDEAGKGIEATRAKLKQAEINLGSARVTAPFDARVKAKMIELNEYVAPGVPVVTLADDAVLEISVPLDSAEARRWLVFTEEREADTAWFSKAEQVECEIEWSDDPTQTWQGQLNRIEGFDEMSRTLGVAIRLTAEQAAPKRAGALPLVDGMFCEVRIPGKIMEGVIRLPRSAVTFEGTVFTVENNRLRTVEVEMAHEQGGEAFISKGLAADSLAVITRLINPMENALLDVAIPGEAPPS